jgi:hypothetical protein
VISENIKYYKIFIVIIFLLINYIAHIYSVDNATYIYGADAGRYYIPALDFVSGKGLGDISSTGPLYPLYIASHIWIFGEHYAQDALVITQSFLLLVTGYIVMLLAKDTKLPTPLLIVFMFVVLNPNSIMVAHFIQTETVFTFLLIMYFYFIKEYVNLQNTRTLLYLSIVAVLVSYARPAGMYVMLFFFLITMLIGFKGNLKVKLISHCIVYYVILLTGLGLLASYNHKIHGEYFVSANKGFVFYDQYIGLLQYGRNLSAFDAHKIAKNTLKNEVDQSQSICIDNLALIQCRDKVASTYIKKIINEDPAVIFKAFSSSVANLMLSGGASNFSNYYGIDTKKQINNFEHSKGGMFQITKIIKLIENTNMSYFIALIVFWGWAVITKILMVIGIYHGISQDNKLYFYSIFVLILLFILEFMFLGQSRWRVPLDPIFMMFSAVGATYLIRKFKKQHFRHIVSK